MMDIKLKLGKLSGDFHSKLVTVIVLLLFASIFVSISLVNHYNFRTYGYDLGIYTNTLYDYSKLQVNDNAVMHKAYDNILADHLSLYHIFFAPFRYLFGSWTLLIFQILAILFGSVGASLFVKKITSDNLLSHLSLIHFLSIWGIYSALGFDYHDNVVAAMFVPWLFYAIEVRNIRLSVLFSLLIAIGKENMALWLSFIFLGVVFWKRHDRKLVILSLCGSVVSILYFLLAVKFIMPALGTEAAKGDYLYLKYSSLGNGLGEYVKTLITRPKYVFSLLFENHSGDSTYDGIKTELFYMVLLSGGLGLVYRPQFMLMLVPIFAQKLFNDSYGKWGLNNHYSIEFVPVLTIALFYWLHSSVKRKFYLYLFASVSVLLTVWSSISVVEKRTSKWYDKTALCFWDKSHYVQAFDTDAVRSYLKTIPSDAAVCAQNPLVPRLALRDKIYTFPFVRDAEYVLLLTEKESYWPASHKEYHRVIDSLKATSLFETLVDTKGFSVYKRK